MAKRSLLCDAIYYIIVIGSISVNALFNLVSKLIISSCLAKLVCQVLGFVIYP